MIRYRVALSISYQFDRPTGAARQLLRICPAALPHLQQVTDCRVQVEPEPSARHEFSDFFGTRVVELALPAGLTSLTIRMTADVLRHDPGPAADRSALRASLAADLAAQTGLDANAPHHFLAPSPRIPVVPEIGRFAARATQGAPTTRAAVEALGAALQRAMRFDAAATTVDTPIATAFEGRHGVCQDFSQIMIAGLRSLEIPAAYVSGFLRTVPPPGQPRLQGADAMHAWVRAWTGREGGWCEYDPTNACFAGTEHVVIGHGRDYADAAPVIGMLRLEGAQSGAHSVDLEALD